MARTGGVCTFLMIGAVIAAMLLGILAKDAPALGIVGLAFNFAAFVLWFVVMIALKVDFAQNGFPRGGVIWAIIALTLLIIVVGIAAAITVGLEVSREGATPEPAAVLRSFGNWGVALGLMFIALQFCFLLLGVRLTEYGAIGGGVWKGAGIVLIIAASLGMLITALYVLAVLLEAWGLIIVAGIIGLIAALLWAVVWLLIGIGFMGDANRLAMAGAPARRGVCPPARLRPNPWAPRSG